MPEQEYFTAIHFPYEGWGIYRHKNRKEAEKQLRENPEPDGFVIEGTIIETKGEGEKLLD